MNLIFCKLLKKLKNQEFNVLQAEKSFKSINLIFCKPKKSQNSWIYFLANWKNEYLLISARWNSRIRIRFWIGSERNDNMMHQKDCLTPRILFSSQIQDWRKTLWGPNSFYERTYDNRDIRSSRIFSLKFDIGFHISDDIIIFDLNF